MSPLESTHPDPQPGCPDGAGGRPLRRDAEANRVRILRAAGEIFAQGGLGATMDEIAEHAGVGVGTLYRRFPSKASLIDALFDERIGRVEALAEEALTHKDAWEGLVFFLQQVQALQACDRGLVNALFDPVEGADDLVQRRGRLHSLGQEMVSRAQAQGHLRPDVEATDIPLLLLMVSTITLYTRETAPDTSARFLGLCIDGLRTQRRHPTPLPAPALDVGQLDRSIAPWASSCPVC
jgi:AcrR family transcriptional regulator